MRCENMENSQKLLNWEAIKQQCPENWVMIGYPESEYNLADDVRKGVILYADTDSEATTQFSADNIQALRAKKAYRLYTIKFTGEIPKATTPRLGKRLVIDFEREVICLE